MNRLAALLVLRLIHAFTILAGVLVIDFLLLHLAPGDIAQVLAGENGAADPAYVNNLRIRLGLDQPLPIQLATYAWHVVRLDLGMSFRNNLPVTTLIADRLPATMLLMGSSLALAVGAGVALGVVAARWKDSLIDDVISVVSLLAYATPLFWIGLMMIVLFSVKLRWLPSSGMETLFSGYTGLRRWGDIGLHLIMPALSLALFQLALFTRLLRASLLEILRQDFIRTARAKGISESRVVVRHALRNALLPLVTMVGMHFASTLGGSVVVESVFAWPGLGRLAYDAIGQRDVNLLLGIVLFSALVVIAVNFIIDLLYGWLDPRIETR